MSMIKVKGEQEFEDVRECGDIITCEVSDADYEGCMPKTVTLAAKQDSELTQESRP